MEEDKGARMTDRRMEKTDAGEKHLTVGLVAPVDAGKTTLSEAILHQAGVIRQAGRVDRGSTLFDGNPIERRRGITIFSKQAVLPWKGACLDVLDTPGHIDFSAETERTLSVLDAAVLVLSASDGVRADAEALWRRIRRRGIPTFIFINKMDISIRKRTDILDQIREKLSPGAVDFTAAAERPARDPDWIDALTLASETLAERALEGRDITEKDIRGAAACGEIFPCIFGSALRGDGAVELLDAIVRYAPEPARGSAFGARVFKIMRDPQNARVTFLKVTGGALKVRDVVAETAPDGRVLREKIDQIRFYTGGRYTLAETAEAGRIAAVTGLSATRAGEGLGEDPGEPEGPGNPVMRCAVTAEDLHASELLEDLLQLEEEDPSLCVAVRPGTGEILAGVMGEVQIEVLREIFRTRFGTEIAFGDPSVLYRETVRSVSEGVGHFEPLRHYAEIRVLVEPLPRGAGIRIESAVSEDRFPGVWQDAARSALEGTELRGVLTGSPLMDVRIVIVGGKGSVKHTVGGDFREAAIRAVRCALRKAENELLEPFVLAEADVPDEAVGRVLSDLTRFGGRVEPPEPRGGTTVVRGICPTAGLFGYAAELRSFTSGRGTLSLRFSGYEECRNAGEVLKSAGYDPDRDLEFPSDSVFCAHGSAEIVPWTGVEERAHTEAVLTEDGRVRQSDEAKGAGAGGPADRGIGGTSAEDRELTAIFEKTYGKIRRHPLTAPGQALRDQAGAPLGRERPEGAGPDADPEKDAARNEEIRARHSRQSGTETPRRTLLVVDGYNLIGASDDLKELSKTDFGAAREALAERLANYAAATGVETVLVFDAYHVPDGAGSDSVRRGIRVVYTKEHETADSWIERFTEEVGRNVRLRVATSDALIQQIALGHGALRTSSREFLEELEAVEEDLRREIARRWQQH